MTKILTAAHHAPTMTEAFDDVLLADAAYDDPSLPDDHPDEPLASAALDAFGVAVNAAILNGADMLSALKFCRYVPDMYALPAMLDRIIAYVEQPNPVAAFAA